MSLINWLLLISYISSAIALSVAVATSVGSMWDDVIEDFDEALESLDRAMKGK